jgi:hypothetical protein
MQISKFEYIRHQTNQSKHYERKKIPEKINREKQQQQRRATASSPCSSNSVNHARHLWSVKKNTYSIVQGFKTPGQRNMSAINTVGVGKLMLTIKCGVVVVWVLLPDPFKTT